MGEKQANGGIQQPAKKFFSPFRIALVVLGVLLAFLIVKLILFMTAKPTISVNYVAELNRISKPANYDPNQNAFFDYQKAIERLGEQPEVIYQLSKKWPGDMNDAELEIIKQWVKSNGEALVHLKRGVAKPYLWIEEVSADNNLMKWTPGFDVSGIRQLAFLVSCCAKLEAKNGRITNSIDDILTNLKLSSHFTGAKILVYQLLGISIRAIEIRDAFIILDRQQIDSEILKRFQEQLQQNFGVNENRLDFQSGKLAVYDFIQRVFTDNGKGKGHLIPRCLSELIPDMCMTGYGSGGGGKIGLVKEVWSQFSRESDADLFWFALTGPDRRQTTAMADKLFAYIKTLKNQTPWQLRSKGINPQRQIENMLKNYYALQVAPSVSAIIQLLGQYGRIYYSRYAASEDALIALLAILRYRADKGSFPETLEELVAKGYLESLPMDPFSSGPLVYRRAGDNFTLYSLGADFDDDGGTRGQWRRGGAEGDEVFWPVERPQSGKADKNAIK